MLLLVSYKCICLLQTPIICWICKIQELGYGAAMHHSSALFLASGVNCCTCIRVYAVNQYVYSRDVTSPGLPLAISSKPVECPLIFVPKFIGYKFDDEVIAVVDCWRLKFQSVLRKLLFLHYTTRPSLCLTNYAVDVALCSQLKTCLVCL